MSYFSEMHHSMAGKVKEYTIRDINLFYEHQKCDIIHCFDTGPYVFLYILCW